MVLLAFFILAIQLFITLIEFKLTTVAGFVLIPFGLFGKLRSPVAPPPPIARAAPPGLRPLASPRPPRRSPVRFGVQLRTSNRASKPAGERSREKRRVAAGKLPVLRPPPDRRHPAAHPIGRSG
jgi:TrbL/VirB6 plasmid conjugal transfer protein